MISSPSFLFAFGAGLLSFLSPCVLPLLPAYLGFLTGMSRGELSERAARRPALKHALAFLAGFGVVFLALGALVESASIILTTYGTPVRVLGGVIVLLLGLVTLGALRAPWLKMERRTHLARKPAGYLGSALVGLAFAAGWTPCMGPILAGVLFVAAQQPGLGVPLLLTYALGFSVPFLLGALFLERIRLLGRFTPTLERVGGVMMVVAGVLLLTNGFAVMSQYLVNVLGFQGF
ncbi:cytochrome c biogenesis CcdA family protein [Deinococcus peraridilitoris]|uniref:Cytochrome c biogenesis protein n=1 Tax=Deinococcus peraridilitoris (strain DSM 19664 / LMG 22246 / CIP 109416 / KR-200) TaxID=937777 RepID=K9ZX71_DEIPD|nr:cytochrome c biogenesis protein CcdA [Deinococcus peraridilitoris]AFZ66248.1 cytochrome c biogenesis protein [Deinococcus peraridilitoris DSM 19664]